MLPQLDTDGFVGEEGRLSNFLAGVVADVPKQHVSDEEALSGTCARARLVLLLRLLREREV